MNGGTIDENTAKDGGGVHVGGGEFAMELGSSFSLVSIRNNTATHQGGGVNVNNGVFNMNRGTVISGNTVEAKGCGGGGVYVENGGRFNMDSPSSSITGNKVKNPDGYGGGVYVHTKASFTMEDGSISGNSINPKAETYEWQNGDNGDRGIGKGCGVYVHNGGTFIKTDGTIHGLLGKVENGEPAWEDANFQNYYGMKVYEAGSNVTHGVELNSKDGIDSTPGGEGEGYAVYYNNVEGQHRDYTVYDEMSTDKWGADPPTHDESE
jgi:hypothetical protein